MIKEKKLTLRGHKETHMLTHSSIFSYFANIGNGCICCLCFGLIRARSFGETYFWRPASVAVGRSQRYSSSRVGPWSAKKMSSLLSHCQNSWPQQWSGCTCPETNWLRKTRSICKGTATQTMSSRGTRIQRQRMQAHFLT